MKTGQVDLTTRHGEKPMKARMTTSSANATLAETQSRLRISGRAATNPPIRRNEGLREARNGERLDGLGCSSRSLTGLTMMVVSLEDTGMGLLEVDADVWLWVKDSRFSEPLSPDLVESILVLALASISTSALPSEATAFSDSASNSITRAPKAVTRSRSWVTTMTLTPSPRNEWMRPTMRIKYGVLAKGGLIEDDRAGAEASAAATVKRRFSPPESV